MCEGFISIVGYFCDCEYLMSTVTVLDHDQYECCPGISSQAHTQHTEILSPINRHKSVLKMLEKEHCLIDERVS